MLKQTSFFKTSAGGLRWVATTKIATLPKRLEKQKSSEATKSIYPRIAKFREPPIVEKRLLVLSADLYSFPIQKESSLPTLSSCKLS